MKTYPDLDININFRTGEIVGGGCLELARTLAEIRHIYKDSVELGGLEPTTPVYKTWAPPEPDEPALLYGTTLLLPGTVGDEYFMTRGHYHIKPGSGEFTVTLSGHGAAILMDKDRNTWWVEMKPGVATSVDGAIAHRAANIGDEPLVFLTCWMSDCGHDYDIIARMGFSQRLLKVGGNPTLV